MATTPGVSAPVRPSVGRVNGMPFTAQNKQFRTYHEYGNPHGVDPAGKPLAGGSVLCAATQVLDDGAVLFLEWITPHDTQWAGLKHQWYDADGTPRHACVGAVIDVERYLDEVAAVLGFREAELLVRNPPPENRLDPGGQALVIVADPLRGLVSIRRKR